MPDELNNITLNDMERDAIGEIMNISMGAGATALSTLLGKQVIITTPTVDVRQLSQVQYQKLEPAMGVKITYTKGIAGTSLMVMRQSDIRLILAQFMDMPVEEENDGSVEFDEMSISAVCEIMNQMMGSGATSLSDLLNEQIDISPPSAFVLDDSFNFAQTIDVDPSEMITSITFNLSIEGIMDTEFMSVMTIDLAKQLATKLIGDFGAEMAAAVAEAAPPAEPAAPAAPEPEPEQPAPAPAAAPPPTVPPVIEPAATPPATAGATPTPDYGQAPPPGYGQAPPGAYPYPGYAPGYGAAYYPPPGYAPPGYVPQPQPASSPYEGAAVNVHPVQLQNFEDSEPLALTEEQNSNFKLIMSVPLTISVEIGKTKKKIREILEFSQGTILELEKAAEAPVDVIVNGQLIAKGDVVVVDENFAVRITEILKPSDLLNVIV